MCTASGDDLLSGSTQSTNRPPTCISISYHGHRDAIRTSGNDSHVLILSLPLCNNNMARIRAQAQSVGEEVESVESAPRTALLHS